MIKASRVTERDYVAYTLTDAERAMCRREAIRRYDNRPSYRKRSTQWSSGSVGDHPAAPIFVGLIGEVAVAEVFRVWFPDFPAADVTVRREGDVADFVFRGMAIDVKTHSTVSQRGCRVREDHSKPRTTYIFACLCADQTVFLRGCVTGAELLERGKKFRGKSSDGRSTWVNRSIFVDDLRPVGELVRYFNSR